jgi:hypothetical protein
LDLAEPHFDGESADFIVSNLMRSGDLAARFDGRLADVAVAAWDLISEPMAIALLDHFPPAPFGNQIQRGQTVLWSVLSLRVPEEWQRRFEQLSDDEALAIVSLMTPPVAERVPLAAAERLHALGTATPIDAAAAPTLAVLADRLGREAIGDFDEGQLPAPVVVRLAWRKDASIEPELLLAAVEDLTATVAGVIADAREGKAGFGVENPVHALVSGLAASGVLPDPTLRLLIETATDAALPRHLRFDAIKALTTLVDEDLFDPATEPELLARIPVAGAEAFFGEYPPSLMRAAKVELAVASGTIVEYLPQLLVSSRDPDPRIRINAIKAAVHGRRHRDDELLETILLAGLFDPAAQVIELSLDGFAALPPTHEATQAALAQRLPELFASGGREIRLAIAGLVGNADLPALLIRVAAMLREAIALDRCFRVRIELGEPEAEHRSDA